MIPWSTRFSPLFLVLALMVLVPASGAAPPDALQIAQADQAVDDEAKPETAQTPRVRLFEGVLVLVDEKGLRLKVRSGRRINIKRGNPMRVRGYKNSWDELAVGDRVKLRLRGNQLLTVIVGPDAEQQEERERLREEALEKLGAGKAGKPGSAKPR